MAKGLLINEGGFVIEKGGFAFGETLEQETSSIIQHNYGDCPEDILLAVNLISKMNSTDLGDITRTIELALQRDNKEAKKIKIENGTIKTNVREI
jgi:hypothetical protein